MCEEKLENCVVVKVMLMFIVILFHSLAFWTVEWWGVEPVYPSAIIGNIARWLSSFHVYAFTLVSGYIFAYKCLRGGIAHLFLLLRISQSDC